MANQHGNTRVVFSIGLNVGAAEPAGQLGRTLSAVDGVAGAPESVATGASEWDGVPERFVHVAVPFLTRRRALLDARLLAVMLCQDAVAVLLPGAAEWTLVRRDSTVGTGGSLADFPVRCDL